MAFRLTVDERETLGERLRMARQTVKPKLTVRSVATKFGVSLNTVHAWEHGSLPGEELRPLIASLYDVDEDILFAEHEAHVAAARALLRPA